jgi:hypothetical protein
MVQQFQKICVEAGMKLQRLEDETCVQTVDVSSQGGGPLTIAFAGASPKVSWSQLRDLRSRLTLIAEATQQELVVTNDGQLLIRVAHDREGKAKVSIRWWTVAKQFVFGVR